MSILDKTLGIIAPHECIVCHDEGALLCKSCGLSLPTIPSICYACGRATSHNSPCSRHAGKLKPDHVFIHSEYKDDIKKLLHLYKFDYKRAAAKDIAMLMADTFPYYPIAPLITYVPTIGAHVRQRGFDHAKLITKELAKINGWPYAQLLFKTKNVTQIGATRVERKKQLSGVLEVSDELLIKKASILLVDDVITTGATIEACTAKLIKAGAAEVDVAALARTP